MDDDAVAFVRSFYEQGKPIAAICHAPWMLVEAGIARDHTLTSFWSVKTDVRNAGGNWVDQELVVDEGIVTSRSPDDLPAFCSKIVEEIAEDARAPTDPRRGHRLVGGIVRRRGGCIATSAWAATGSSRPWRARTRRSVLARRSPRAKS